MIEKLIDYCKKHRLVIATIVFSIFYCISFLLLEARVGRIHLIHVKLDDYIPFCEYFIIPYVFWFIYVYVGVFWFLKYNQDKTENEKMIYSLMFGMATFVIISYIYPNGHDLRPQLTGDNFFERCVMFLYTIDTSTNILPSLHVYNTLPISTALLRHPKFGQNKWMRAAIYVITVSIIMATVCLKQHSIVDVIMALVMYAGCYACLYKVNWNKVFSSNKKSVGFARD